MHPSPHISNFLSDASCLGADVYLSTPFWGGVSDSNSGFGKHVSDDCMATTLHSSNSFTSGTSTFKRVGKLRMRFADGCALWTFHIHYIKSFLIPPPFGERLNLVFVKWNLRPHHFFDNENEQLGNIPSVTKLNCNSCPLLDKVPESRDDIHLPALQEHLCIHAAH